MLNFALRESAREAEEEQRRAAVAAAQAKAAVEKAAHGQDGLVSELRTPTKIVVKKVANTIPFEQVSFKLRGLPTLTIAKPLTLKISAKGRARGERAFERDA